MATPDKSPTVFFDCRDCGWSCGTNNDEFAVEFIPSRIRDHLTHDPRHLGLPRGLPEPTITDTFDRAENRLGQLPEWARPTYMPRPAKTDE